jgi:phage shock protein PspC (stress-responsive transcriptional regulator)
VNPRRLYRSRTDRVLTGIAGGMAQYLEVDPTIVRILWVLATIFTGGLILLLYIVLAFVIPVNPFQGGPVPAGAWGAGYAGAGPVAQAGWGQPGAAPAATGATAAPGTAYATGYAAGGAPAWNPDWDAGYQQSRAARTERPGRAGLIIGSVLIVFGVIALADVVIPGWISGALVIPGLFVALGVGLLVASLRGSSDQATAAAAPAGAPAPPAFGAAEPASSSTASTTDAPAEVDAAPAVAYDEDATSTLPPQPGSDPA